MAVPEPKQLEVPSKKHIISTSERFEKVQLDLKDSRQMKSSIFGEANHMYLLFYSVWKANAEQLDSMTI